MVTYLYWAAIIALAFGLLYVIGHQIDQWKIAVIASASVLLIGFIAYDFYFQQVFVKRYGGVMTIKMPEGEVHLAATWKDDNLWIENYHPETNTCHFREYSRGNLLQGQVTIKNCNPLLRQTMPLPAQTP
jgi:apolipoprotein N-acyltransferase